MRQTTKASLASLLFIAPSGALFTFLKPSLSTSNTSFSQGSAISGLVGNKDYSLKDKKLNIKNSEAISLGTNLNTELSNNLKIDLNPISSTLIVPTEDLIDTASSGQNIRKILKEIDKESEVMEIKKESTQLVQNSKNQLNGKGSTFKQAKKIIVEETIQQLQKTYNLELIHRKIIEDYLSVFSNLEKEKSQILQRLLVLEDNSNKNLEEQLENSKFSKLKLMIQSLQEIGWINEPSRIFKHNPSLNSGTTSSSRERELGWGDWSTKNPFRHFFDSQEEWLQCIDKISLADKELFHYLGNPAYGFVNKLDYRSTAPHSPELEKLIEASRKAHNELEAKIGKKLLEEMKSLTNV